MEGGICSRTVYALATPTWCLLLAQSACATSVGWRSRLLRDCLQKVFFFLCFFEADRFVVCCWPAVGLGGREPDPVCRLSPISPPFSVSCFFFLLKPWAESGSCGLTSTLSDVACTSKQKKWVSSYPELFYLVSFAGKVPCVTAGWAAQ